MKNHVLDKTPCAARTFIFLNVLLENKQKT